MDLGFEPVKYAYSSSLKWTGEHKGLLSSLGKPNIQVACPPEWGGHPGIWSPEDLFVGSVEVCTLTTFLFLLEKLRGRLLSYESTAEGSAQMVDNVFVFKDVVVKVSARVPTREDADKALGAFSEIDRWCLVTKSVRCQVKVEPEVSVG